MPRKAKAVLDEAFGEQDAGMSSRKPQVPRGNLDFVVELR